MLYLRTSNYSRGSTALPHRSDRDSTPYGPWDKPHAHTPTAMMIDLILITRVSFRSILLFRDRHRYDQNELSFHVDIGYCTNLFLILLKYSLLI